MRFLTIAAAMTQGTKELQSVSTTPQLDTEVFLMNILQVSRAYCYAWPERELTWLQQEKLLSALKRRKQSEPVAYIVGYQEFWSLPLKVNGHVLIPRPETELVVELTLQLLPAQQTAINIADLGTGSGAIALALAKERPHWKIHATDYHALTLELAKKNAEAFNLTNVTFYQGDWCQALPAIRFDALVSNPPYLTDIELTQSPKELSYEPAHALTAGKDGLDAIRAIIAAVPTYLKPAGYLVLEHGFQQAASVRTLLEKNFKAIVTYQDLAGLDRVTVARGYE